jgi:hypothetical protein
MFLIFAMAPAIIWPFHVLGCSFFLLTFEIKIIVAITSAARLFLVLFIGLTILMTVRCAYCDA